MAEQQCPFSILVSQTQDVFTIMKWRVQYGQEKPPYIRAIQGSTSCAKRLPLQHPGAVFVNEALVVGHQRLHIWKMIRLRVEVVLVEALNPRQHFHVFLIAQVHVVPASVPGIETMVPATKIEHLSTLK